jgi:mono/diheme cytochrome c family protein
VQVPLCATAAEITSKIFMPKCGACHGGATPRAGLDLVMPGAKARLLNIPAKNMACAGRPLIVDSPAVGGVFFDKVSGNTCGNQMPFMGMALSAAEIQCLKDWIKPSPPPAAPPFDPACATAAEIQSKIFTPKCATCHGGNMPRAGLDLATAGSKARLLAATAKNPACMGRPLVSPDATGVFFDKVTGMACGNQMPFMGTPLNATEVQCLKEWIKPTMTTPPPPPADAGAPPVNNTPMCAVASEISAKILVPVCGACHGAINPAAGLDLASAGAKARLLNIPSKGCAGKPLIVADPVPAGVFFDKLAGPVPGCGNQMPFGAPPLGPVEVKCLKDWIKPLP